MKTTLFLLILTAASSLSYSQKASTLISHCEKAVLKVVEAESNELIGTAFLVSADGLVLSCYHVLDSEKELMARDKEDRPLRIDSVLGYSKELDYILFRVSSYEGSDKVLPFLEISDAPMQKGADVLAIGHVAGHPYLATCGTIAGYETDSKSPEGTHKDVFFTAPVYYASSGSPLIISETGKVAGIIKKLTIYQYKQVPNINICLDITAGLASLKNIQGITYNLFLDSIIRNNNSTNVLLSELFEEYYNNEEEEKKPREYHFDQADFEDYVNDNIEEVVSQYISEAKYLAGINKTRKAAAKMNTALALGTDKESLYLEYADVLIMGNNLKKARRLLLEALESYPDNYKLWQKLAEIALIQDDKTDFRSFSLQAYLLRETEILRFWRFF